MDHLKEGEANLDVYRIIEKAILLRQIPIHRMSAHIHEAELLPSSQSRCEDIDEGFCCREGVVDVYFSGGCEVREAAGYTS